MVIPELIKQKINKIWDEYLKDGKKVIDLKGNESLAEHFDYNRNVGIEVLKDILYEFLTKKVNLKTFKSALDGENKRNNYWGFSAIKGQMFFNQLVNSQNGNLSILDELLINCISEPHNIEDAKNKIQTLEQFVKKIYEKEDDKRKSPKPSSIPYFLSYFWQIHNYKKWPIYYTSLINSLKELEIWNELNNQYENYEYFYNIIFKIKGILEDRYGKELTHWDVEHCFWWSQLKIKRKAIKKEDRIEKKQTELKSEIITSFEFYDYVPPIISNLIVTGQQKGEGRTSKGVVYERQVALAFRMLDFIIEEFGQGKGREPDAIATYRPENIAFIIDAKVRPDGYSIGVDDRAIKEYINNHLAKLRKEGYKKNGFIIVCSLFKGDPNKFVDDITLETDIKRLTLLTSEALLYLVAFKLKDSISTTEIANVLLQNGVIEARNIIEAFEDI